MCNAKSCKYWKKCAVKSECEDYRCADYEADYSYTPTNRRPSSYERTRAQVYATGNKWAIENFHATHD